jgi:hypothetical protein
VKRPQLIELEDLPWWPHIIRDAATDFLVMAIRHDSTYSGLVPRLTAALRRTGATWIVDFCSGAGGPWAELLPALRSKGVDVSLCLTDRYPNTPALETLAAGIPGVWYDQQPVSATDMPPRLATGFRTVFTAFHHFRPAEARAILAAAVRDQQGIVVAEATCRSPAALAMMVLVPLAVWLLTPAIRPFRWSRLFWTYLVPVVPLAVMFDGVVSCLRIYTPVELLAMAREASGEAYDWQAGVEYSAGSTVPIPYLIGTPREPPAGMA